MLAPIAAGDWIHSHNLTAGQFERDYEFATDATSLPPTEERRTFAGYRRADGRAGTRNYVAVISSVNCAASVMPAPSSTTTRSSAA